MQLALYHNLPPGGALRAVAQFLAHLPVGVKCDVYRIDLGELSHFPRSAMDVDAQAAGAVVVPAAESVWPKSLRRSLLGQASLLHALHAAEEEVAKAINGRPYDAVIVHPCWVSQAPHILTKLKGPTVYYMHEIRRLSFERLYRATEDGDASAWASMRRLAANICDYPRKRSDLRAVSAATQLLCNSCFSAESIQMLYGRFARVAYLGVDRELFRPSDEHRHQRVLSVGGMEAFKGHHHVLEAVGRIPKSIRPELHCVFERYDPSYLQRLVENARHAGVTLVQHSSITDEDLAQLFRTSRVTALAAQLEPFGLAALESMASGTPVVAYREAGYRETVIDGEGGLLVDRSVAALSEGLRMVCSDPNRWAPERVRETVGGDWAWDAAVSRQLKQIEITVRNASRAVSAGPM